MYSVSYLAQLVDTFRSVNSTENEWLDFKSNYITNQELGEYISALSNGAVSQGKPFAYLIFGVDDATHEVTGTSYRYRQQKQGNEELENWLRRLVEPKIAFDFYEFEYSAGKRVLLVEIAAAYQRPTAFNGKEYTRVGSCNQSLMKHPEKERQLWNMLGRVSYEQTVCVKQNLHFKQLSLLADSLGIDFSPENFPTLRMLDTNGNFNNLALLLSDENEKIVKFAVYNGNSMNFRVKKEFSGSWLAMLDQVLEYSEIYNDVSVKVIGNSATRTEVQSYPAPSLREIVVNAFGHLDLTFPSDIKIEFYPDRAEIASPGALYRTTMQEIFSGRQSFRNPDLIYVMNKFGYIENYATGIKKVALAYAPYSVKPDFVSSDNFFVVTLPSVVNESSDCDAAKSEAKNGTNEAKNEANEAKNGTNEAKNEANIGDIESVILALVEENGAISQTKLAEILAVSRATVQRTMKKLQKAGKLKREGALKGGRWKVVTQG